MFYSHEILTERTYGIATIWLVATLGVSRTIHRKLGRKEILSVNLPKACDTVTNPKAPLALRLQSNLLIGISRVYKQQYEYLYHDVAHAHTSIRKLDLITKEPNLNLARGGEGRPEQLVLLDDPNLFPDLLAQLDLAEIGLGDLSLEDLENGSLVDFAESLEYGTSADHSVIQPHGTSPAGSVGGLHRGFQPGPSTDRDAQKTPVPADVGDSMFDENPLFVFNEDGEMRDVTPELPPPLPEREQDETPTPMPGSRARPRAPSSRFESEDVEEQVRREHEEAGQPELGGYRPDAEDVFPDFPQQMDLGAGAGARHVSSGLSLPAPETKAPKPGEEHPMAAEAAGRFRGPRVNHITIDEDTTLTNQQMRSFARDYLQNMETARKAQEGRRLHRTAKSNANMLVLEYGIGGKLENPILKALFSGQAILNALHGDREAVRKRKRGPGEDASDEEEARRIRARTQDQAQELEQEQEIGRDIEPAGDVEMELGREAPSDLGRDDEHSLHSDMRTGVFTPVGAPSSSAGGLMSSPGLLGDVRGISRISLARSVRSNLERLEEENETAFGFGLDDSIDQSEFFGAGADVSTQEANSQWQRDTMEIESNEFLEYLKNKLSQECERKAAELEGHPQLVEESNFITFQRLVNYNQDRIVAAQAFSHTLLLASKGLISVGQARPYGNIQICLMQDEVTHAGGKVLE